ncbi:MAG: hydrolase TatD [Gammaproteobacteria bacterium]|nr:MAG: hydrolase TatD [Gammaproteobacteria bacterium]
MELIDIGANLTHSSFRQDLDEVIEEAHNVGVSTIIVTGASDEGNVRALELARKYPGKLFATAGVHPHHAGEYTDASRELILDHARHDEVVAIGETGLDYNRNYSPHPSQKSVFESQLEIAAELQKPVFMHLRDAYEDFAGILSKYRDRIPAAVAHCFTGTEKELVGLLDMDLYIGITGWICDERRGHHLHEFIHKIPSDRLMLETDAPYLLPRDLKPKPKDRRNVPANMPHIVETVAKVLNKPVAQVAQETTSAARTFFRLEG